MSRLAGVGASAYLQTLNEVRGLERTEFAVVFDENSDRSTEFLEAILQNMRRILDARRTYFMLHTLK